MPWKPSPGDVLNRVLMETLIIIGEIRNRQEARARRDIWNSPKEIFSMNQDICILRLLLLA